MNGSVDGLVAGSARANFRSAILAMTFLLPPDQERRDQNGNRETEADHE